MEFLLSNLGTILKPIGTAVGKAIAFSGGKFLLGLGRSNATNSSSDTESVDYDDSQLEEWYDFPDDVRYYYRKI